MKKQIFGVCTAICLMLMTVFPAFAAAETSPYDDSPIVFTTMVSDAADILTDSEEEELEARAWELTVEYQCAVYIITVPGIGDLEAWEATEFHVNCHDQIKLAQKAKELDEQKQEFQTKYQNNAYLSQERAQQEYNRIAKLEQDLQQLSNQLQSELMQENEKNSLQLRDSINAFLKEYNKTKGYSLIISNTGFDNLLYADSIYNITREIVDGLNARYSSPAKK